MTRCADGPGAALIFANGALLRLPARFGTGGLFGDDSLPIGVLRLVQFFAAYGTLFPMVSAVGAVNRGRSVLSRCRNARFFEIIADGTLLVGVTILSACGGLGITVGTIARHKSVFSALRRVASDAFEQVTCFISRIVHIVVIVTMPHGVEDNFLFFAADAQFDLNAVVGASRLAQRLSDHRMRRARRRIFRLASDAYTPMLRLGIQIICIVVRSKLRQLGMLATATARGDSLAPFDAGGCRLFYQLVVAVSRTTAFFYRLTLNALEPMLRLVGLQLVTVIGKRRLLRMKGAAITFRYHAARFGTG